MKHVLRHCWRGASRCLARESTCTAGDSRNFRLGGPTPRRSVTMGYQGALLPHAMTLLLDDPACIYDIRVIAEDCYWLPKNDALFVQAILPVFRTPQRSGLGHGRDTRHVGRFGEPKKDWPLRDLEREKESSIAGSEAMEDVIRQKPCEEPPDPIIRGINQKTKEASAAFVENSLHLRGRYSQDGIPYPY